MTVISDAQIAGLAKAAGLPNSAIAVAVAVALAETNGDTAAHNYNLATGDDSWGLWQINMLGPLGPTRRAQFNITSNDQLLDPATNAKAMTSISHNGSYWGDWSTYTSGKYLAYLTRGRTAAGSPADTSVTTVSNTSSFAGLGTLFQNLSDVHFWIRVGEFIVGSYLIYIALIRLTGAVDKIAKLSKTAAKIATVIPK